MPVHVGQPSLDRFTWLRQLPHLWSNQQYQRAVGVKNKNTEN